MYGDNKANERKVNLLDVKYLTSNLDDNTFHKLSFNHGGCTKEDILELAQQSQEITDKLNQLYEQMKGE